MSDTNTTESTTNVSFLDLPDDELGKYSPYAEPASAAPVGGSTPAGAGEGAAGGDVASDGSAGTQEEQALNDEGEGTAPPSTDGAGEATGEGAQSQEAKPDATQAQQPGAETAAAADANKTETDKGGIDYEAAYKELMAPFKANGREMTVRDAEEARALMQMGANYHKKMAALKPNLALLKLLENNGLLNEEKISWLIDLSKKDEGAINKLVKESGLDPLDLSAEKADEYKPKTHQVDPKELALDEVLEQIQDTPTFERTLQVVTKEWDQASKQAVVDAPQVLKVLNAHIQAGYFDLITAEVERERVLGRLSGMSDLEAYRQVGDAINARGGFAHLGRQEQQTPPAKTVVTPAPKKVEDDKRNEKRRAASPSKPAASTSAPPADFNPLSLSDEEFNKLMAKQLR